MRHYIAPILQTSLRADDAPTAPELSVNNEPGIESRFGPENDHRISLHSIRNGLGAIVKI